MTADLTRATTFDVDAEGRTLLGLAFRWEHPSLVTEDPGVPPYLEEFTRGSTTKTLRERVEPFPLLRHHRLGDVLGAARFAPSSEGLAFEAKVSRTSEGDDALELVRDGALRSVSVRFRPINQRTRHSIDGPVVSRTEIMLRELSLAPTGFGVHDGAQVLALRAETDRRAPSPARRRLLLAELDDALASIHR